MINNKSAPAPTLAQAMLAVLAAVPAAAGMANQHQQWSIGLAQPSMNEGAPTLGMSSGSGTYGSDCDTGCAVAESSSPAWGNTHKVRADQVVVEATMATQLHLSRTCELSEVLKRPS